MTLASGRDQSNFQKQKEQAMGIISMIVVGFIIGLIARAIMPGEQKLGFILTVVLGIVGSLLAGYLGAAVGLYSPGQGAGWIGSIVGAIIVLLVWGLVTQKGS
jgi:uncharacterized membrane protein YeaQ/YmgE (transglycosylase-associated protein family)